MAVSKDDIQGWISAIVKEEQFRAALAKGETFIDSHHAYGALKEEVEEASEEMEYIKESLDFLWKKVRKDENTALVAKHIKQAAERLAYEAIQVAAVAQKHIDSLDKKDD